MSKEWTLREKEDNYVALSSQLYEIRSIDQKAKRKRILDPSPARKSQEKDSVEENAKGTIQRRIILTDGKRMNHKVEACFT